MSRKRLSDAMKKLMSDPELAAFFKKSGRKGGLIGGPLAASNMTPEQRTARAKKAAEARWTKKRKKS